MAEYTADQSIICPIMVGRDLIVGALAQVIADVRGGHGQTVLISGEAGIGKSRLVRELLSQLRQTNVLVLQGHCFEADRALPYAPIADIVRGLSATAPHMRDRVHRTPELAILLPELRPPSPAAADGSDQDKGVFFRAVEALFLHLAALQPLVMAIEDVHWCDDATLDFLLHIVRGLGRRPLLLILTYRDNEISPMLGNFLAHLDRERLTTEFHLSHLSAEAVAAMVRAIFAMERPPRGEFVDAIFALSEGNPFFIEEMLKSLVASGDIYQVGGKWERKAVGELRIPRTIQISLAERFVRLTPEARDLLLLAAVAGRRFDFALLQALTGADDGMLLRLLRELRDAQFVVEEREDRFAFRHALTRQAAYQGLLTRERRLLHGRIADALLALYGDTPAIQTYASDLAYHFHRAERWEAALAFAIQAGDYAQSRYSPRAALDHYAVALDCCHHLHREPPGTLLRARGKASEITGDFEMASQSYTQTLHAAYAAHDQYAAWQSLLDLGFLFTGLDFAKAGDYFQQALGIARTLGNPAALAETLNRVGNWIMNQDLPLDALPYYQEALTIYTSQADLPGQATTLDLLGVNGVVSGDIVSSAVSYDRAIGLFRTLDNRISLSSSLAVTSIRGGNCMAETVYCPPTGLAFLRQTAAEARQIAESIGWQHGEAAADMYASYGLLLHGEFDMGLACSRRVSEIAEAVNHRLYQAAGYMCYGRTYNEMLAFERGRDFLEQGWTEAQAISGKFLASSLGGFLISSYIGLGQLDEAARVAKAVHTEVSQSVGQRIVRAAEAELAVAQGDTERALAVIAALIESAPSSAGKVIPRLWLLKAEALRSLGASDTAFSLLEAAATESRQQETWALLWRVLASLSRLELERGRREQAESYAQQCRTLWEQLAGHISDSALRVQFLTRAESFLPKLAPRSARHLTRQHYDGLTEREREIAILIAKGHSSREIAEHLVLSKRTVDAHTANILSKLGFASRTQIVRWAIEKALL